MIVLVGFFIAKTGGVVTTVVSVMTGFTTIATFILGVLQIRVPRLPPIGPRATRGVVASILAIEFLVTVGLGGWSWHLATRDVDVLAKVALTGSRDVRPGGSIGLDVPVTAHRDGIELVFGIVDHNAETGNCAPFTELLVVPSSAGNSGRQVRAVPDRPVWVGFARGATKLHLDVTVTNIKGDRNCGVDLSVTSAKLTNK
jgi:hypothetical protein